MYESSATADRYNHVARIYEALSSLYSLGKIRDSKLAELEYIEPGVRVLFVGAGGGEDAAAAAAKGAEVTAIDLAPAMISRVEAKLRSEGLDVETIVGDVLDHDRHERYDAVCANYFLNVFNSSVMQTVLEHLVGLVKPGGLLMIADFSNPRGGRLARGLHVLCVGLANVGFWLLTRNAVHPVYDYRAHGEALGLTHRETVLHPLFPGGPTYFQTTVPSQA
ncbi:MAG: methyltransferase domain-containing protein [Acidimicrobiia bacterium]|jgi:2-polyprenyl-3-methyl-5-hydroxy-6-metoxy-1,4-benzoquinol methylase